jgi:hypothetical protein
VQHFVASFIAHQHLMLNLIPDFVVVNHTHFQLLLVHSTFASGSSPYALRNDLTNGELYSIPIIAKPKANGALFSIASRCSSFVSIAVATGQTASALR